MLTHRTLGSTLHPPITSCPQDTSLLCSLKTVHEFFSVLEFRSHPALRDGDISAEDLFGWFSEVKGQGRRADEGAWDKLRDVIRVQLPNRTRPCICICMCDVGGFACMHVMLIPPQSLLRTQVSLWPKSISRSHGWQVLIPDDVNDFLQLWMSPESELRKVALSQGEGGRGKPKAGGKARAGTKSNLESLGVKKSHLSDIWRVCEFNGKWSWTNFQHTEGKGNATISESCDVMRIRVCAAGK